MPSSGFYKFKKHKLSYIEYNAVSTEKGDKNNIIWCVGSHYILITSWFLNLFSNPP
jgi:hypothetical protein